MKKTAPKRLQWIDAWRGAAVLGMIIVHIVMVLDFGEIMAVDSLYGGWYWLTQFVRFSFLGLVGVSMVIMLNGRFDGNAGKQFWSAQLLRFRIVAGWALAATVASWIVYPEWFIRFGILHLIAVAILLCVWVAHLPRIAGVLGVMAILTGWGFRLVSTDSWFLHWLGAWPAYSFSSMDFFPLFPWLALPFFGITFGHWLYKNDRIGYLEKQFGELTWTPLQWFVWVGQRALKVYLWQGGVILAIVFVGRLFFL